MYGLKDVRIKEAPHYEKDYNDVKCGGTQGV